MKLAVVCCIDGCLNPARTRYMCGRHYHRWLRHGDPLAGRVDDGETRRYFESHVVLETDECILWPYATTAGYGCATIDGRRDRVHVLACEWAHGPRPERMDAAHSCGVALCFNPRHLRWATRVDNAADHWRPLAADPENYISRRQRARSTA